MPILFILLAAVLVLLVPEPSFAWGPGVHMASADWLFSNLSLLPPAVAQCIGNHKDAFRYGCLSADIFIGKGCRVTPTHSHNWSMGLGLLENVSATSDQRLRAYAYGYLSHLALDTVAHNNYVPTLLSATPTAGKFSHVYIEMQADRMVRWDKRLTVKLFEQSENDADKTLLATLQKHNARGNFMIKKQLFKNAIAVSGLTPWKRSLGIVSTALPAAADRQFFSTMWENALRAMIDVLRAPERSAVTGVDPIGEKALDDAKALCRGRTAFAFRSPYPLRFPLDARIRSLPPVL